MPAGRTVIPIRSLDDGRGSRTGRSPGRTGAERRPGGAGTARPALPEAGPCRRGVVPHGTRGGRGCGTGDVPARARGHRPLRRPAAVRSVAIPDRQERGQEPPRTGDRPAHGAASGRGTGGSRADPGYGRGAGGDPGSGRGADQDAARTASHRLPARGCGWHVDGGGRSADGRLRRNGALPRASCAQAAARSVGSVCGCIEGSRRLVP